ncbi:lasso peptide biosynthesis B2 protein [Paenibacillus alba]|uniref:Lasso peptide biosynthesis B2 protein n=1 Tax=Paenibacillus alba TaxID=1197127 RepID=A0ABU6G332_9BACL|nr:lasso peptide biosynthesis B2 protein [Paenibacillus alba]MEC0228010.1 lasso peptide biosynthesis B2 protein [Paenibacillus alba]NQX66755.1 lasso peptide biosynthesis B2 protein [Paenibacillus alba]
MGFFSKIKLLFSLELKTVLLYVEVLAYLGWARIQISVPFSKVAPTLGVKMEETPQEKQDRNRTELIRIQDAIQLISQHTPWESKCLVKAIAASKMLAKRRIASTLYLGTARDESGQMIAHAWLRSGPYYITGAEGMEKFAVIGKFAKYASE